MTTPRNGNGGGFVEHRLGNELRIVIEPMPHVRSAAAGFLVRTGARDERPEDAGISHFLEHMCFKGTPRRSWRQITVDFDNMGSTYNAYTSKEKTFYFGWVRESDLAAQIELLADMMRSVIPPDEFEMEKKVVLEEIAMSADQLDRHVYDLIHERAFAGHPLAWPVLGTAESVGSLTHDRMRAYFEDRYQPANMVLIVCGNIEPAEVIDAADRICGSWPSGSPRPARTPPAPISEGVAVSQTDRFQQQAVALIYPAASARDEDRETADVTASILGGHNSRFYWKIMQAGIAPSVAAGRMDYCDCGLMALWGACEPSRVEEMVAAIRREVRELVDRGVSEEEVQRVKNRTRTALATEAEAPYYRLAQMAGEIDILGAPRSANERLAMVDAVSARGVADYLRRWPLDGPGFITSVGPLNWPNL